MYTDGPVDQAILDYGFPMYNFDYCNSFLDAYESMSPSRDGCDLQLNVTHCKNCFSDR